MAMPRAVNVEIFTPTGAKDRLAQIGARQTNKVSMDGKPVCYVARANAWVTLEYDSRQNVVLTYYASCPCG